MTQQPPPPNYGSGYNGGSPKYQSAPNETQAISLGAGYGAPSHNPGQVPAVKKSQQILMVSAAAYLLAQIISIFASARVIEENPELAAGSNPVSTVIGIALGLGLYYLVYSLINRGKRSGRVTGTVFASIAIVAGLIVGALTAFVSVFAAIFYLAWAILGLVWIIFAYKREVSETLR